MKFGKELASQMVPEWHEAYMDYNFLKGLLKDIVRFQKKISSAQSTTASKTSFKRKMSLYRAFSGLTNCSKASPNNDREDEAILVTAHQQEGSASYRTTFLMSSDDGGEYELVFFRRLDDELNKVNKFYKGKVEQVVKEAEELNKQMDALIALRIRVEDPLIGSAADGVFNFEVAADDGTPGMSHMDAIEEGPEGSMHSVDHEASMADEPTTNSSGNTNVSRRKSNSTEGFRPPPIQVLNHVKINVAPATPVSTLKHMFKSSKSGGIMFDMEGLKKVEEQIKQAFITFHDKLRSLKSYGFINQLAFSKIMKKYDKITSRNASRAYLNMVEKSYIGTSDEAAKLVDRVEATFIKHFSNGNRRNGLSNLRPQPKRQRHRTTFLLGLFSGCAIALIVAIIVVIHARKLLFSKEGRSKYMDNIFPLYSLFGLIVLHMLMYAGDIYFWRRYRVNYPFIFGFKQGTELGYREVLLLSAGLSVVALGGVISNLDMEMDQRTNKFSTVTELVPLGLVTLVLSIAFCPFNIIYRSSRYFLIRCAYHCLLVPLYKVTLPDFFLADQLTSQVQAIRSLQFYVCYYIWGNFTTRSNTCSQSGVFKVFYVIVAVIPYWMRFLQSGWTVCLRRFFEEKDKHQMWNGLKYFSTIVAVVLRTIHDQKKKDMALSSKRVVANSEIMALSVLVFTSSGVATVASMYWDIVIDWGLLDGKSRNRWLRDKLLVPKKNVYFGAIVLNLVLRFAWLQTVLGIYDTPMLHKAALTTLMACLEIIRRGIWNFFRLENEHLNNVGKYRAFKTVPLPFNYDDDEEDKNM